MILISALIIYMTFIDYDLIGNHYVSFDDIEDLVVQINIF
jgi:hypothetical protein